MTKIRVTKEFSFEMAHALEGYDGACKHIHGHSYKLFVTIKGAPCDDINNPKYGMVVDFSVLKRIVNRVIVERYDHAFIIRKTDSNRELIEAMNEHYQNVEVFEFQPTCEVMIAYFAELIRAELPQNLELFSLKLHETATSYAEWYASDNAL